MPRASERERAMKPKVAAVVGPTAVGKTAVSVEVAERLDAEIVSVDSMQIYRGMDVGTAKPSHQLLRRVPHHLIDERDPTHALTVQEFQGLARAAVADVTKRGRLPLLVGGSGLYFRAVVDDLRFPPRAPQMRAALELRVEREGPEVLHARLRHLDPAAAERIEPSNARRLVRALEVIQLTGRPFSAAGRWDRFESIYTLSVAGLSLRRPRLYARITRRVDQMVSNGLAGESARLADAGLGETARQALGYRQVLEGPPGRADEDLAEEIARATKRFARRQESWFRADPRITWFDADGPDVADKLVVHFKSSLGLA